MSIKTLFFILLFILNLNAKERIVSLSPSITEIIYALGKGGELVATSAYSLYPKEAQKLPVVGGYANQNIEKIISLKPTIVIGQRCDEGILKKLNYFGIKTITLDLKTIKDIKNSIKKLSIELDAKTNNLITDINKAITTAPKNDKPHSVMIVYGATDDLQKNIYIAGHNVFFEDIILACGNTNSYTSNQTNQPFVSYENVMAMNPEQIIILYSHTTQKYLDTKKVLKAWRSIPTSASKHYHISIVDEDYIYIPSHRVALSIERLCREMKFD